MIRASEDGRKKARLLLDYHSRKHMLVLAVK